MSDIRIHELKSEHYDAWVPLWNGYLDFYAVPEDARHQAETWSRLLDERSGIHGLGAFDENGTLLGLTHYMFHHDTWQSGGKCYLQDLYTVEAARGRGVGRALIEAVGERAKANGTPAVYWLTQDFNETARALYDKVAELTPFVRYSMKV